MYPIYSIHTHAQAQAHMLAVPMPTHGVGIVLLLIPGLFVCPENRLYTFVLYA